MRLTESDLKFVVQTVATERKDHDHIVGLVRDKADLLELMLDDPKLAARLVHEDEAFIRVSPYLLFAVLLRRVWRDLEGRAFVLERDSRGRRLPVFDARRVVELLGDAVLREYLIEMLCSFVHTNTGVLYFRERGWWHKRKFNDLDMDDMIALCELTAPRWKPRLYKRIADISLFLTGIYPDHATARVRSPRRRATHSRTLPDYEREGRRFYSVAAREPEPPWPTAVFETLSQKFELAREALNALSDHYLQPLRDRFFQPPGN